MRKVLISACLIGEPVRYDGNAMSVADRILQAWIKKEILVPICPEVAAGLPIPRPAAEIIGGDGHDVLAGKAKVVDNTGRDVTRYFNDGARLALSLGRNHHVRVAVLAESSPSCGSSTIYDGSFTRRKMSGEGVTTALLRKNGIPVFSQRQIELADKILDRIGE